MKEKRISAKMMCYEKCSMADTPMIATGGLLKRETIPEGYHCYDVQADESMRQTGLMVAFAGESDQAIGSIILAEPLDFGGKDRVTLERVRLHEEEPMVTLEDFLAMTQGLAQPDGPEEVLGFAQSM